MVILKNNNEDRFIIMHNPEEVKKKADSLPVGSVIFLDVDDTLITPKSNSFRFTDKNEIHLVDEIKSNKHIYPDYAEIISNWRLSRKIMLVDPNWSEVINKLQKNYKVFALTRMDTGKFGNIHSMEEWRYKELKSLNIEFSHLDGTSSVSINYYKGIFMTGDKKKSEVLKAYLPLLQPVHIMFVDDRVDYLEDVADFCSAHNIPFTGVLYRQIEKIPGSIDPKIKLLQKLHLLNNKIWLEDKEAESLYK